MNPALALGSGSPSSLAVKMQAPQFDSPDMTAPIRMNVARQQARIASNEADVSDFQKEYMKMYWGSRFGFARDDGAGDSLAQQDRNRLVYQQLENARKQGRLLDLDYDFQTQLGQPGSLVQVLRQAILGNGGGLLDLVNTLKPPKNGYRR